MDKYNSLQEKSDKEYSMLQNPVGLADTNVDSLEEQHLDTEDKLTQLENSIDGEKQQQEFNAAADNAVLEDIPNQIQSLGNEPKVPMSVIPEKQLQELQSQPSEGFTFDGVLQSNPEDNKFNVLQSFMNRGILEQPVQQPQQLMSVGKPAELPETHPEDVEQKNKQDTRDIITIAKELKKQNPDIPLSQLMEEAAKQKRQEEADALYYRSALELLDVGNRTKTDKKLADAMYKKASENYKTNVAIAAQKDKENKEKKFNDPNSEISKMMKDIASKMGIQIDEETTAKDLMDSGLKLNTLMGLKSNQDIAAMNAAIKQNLADKKEQQQMLKDAEKVKKENQKYYIDMAQRVGALKRGSSFKDLDTKLNAIAEMKAKLKAALRGDVPMNEASANDLSAVWSKALTGGIPAQSLIEKTLPTTVQSTFAKGLNYLANRPVMDFISKKNLKLMQDQMDLLEKAVNIRKGEKLATVYNDYKSVLDSDPQFQEIINRNYGKYVKRNKDGYYEPVKALTLSGAETGKKQGDISDKATEAMIQQVINNAKAKHGVELTREEATEYLKRKGKL